MSHTIQQHIHPTGLSQVKLYNPILNAPGSFNCFAQLQLRLAGQGQNKAKLGARQESYIIPLCWKNYTFGNGTCSSHIPVSTAD